jgi:hypothetical protein
MSTCTAPINIDTKSTTPDSNMIVFNYYEGDCATKKDNDGILIKYADTDQTNNIVYKGYTYVLGSIKLYRKSLHSVNGKYSVGELLMIHKNEEMGALCVCIPISIHIKNTSFGKLLKSVPNKEFKFQSPKTFIPNGTFYSYTGSFVEKCDIPTEYIVFASSNVNITSNELSHAPSHNYKIYKGDEVLVYKHSSSISFGDDKLYIDCQPIDAPTNSTMQTIAGASGEVESINFSDLKNSKFIQMFLMFIVFMIVLVIFFYSYEFTTGIFRELTRSVRGAMPS